MPLSKWYPVDDEEVITNFHLEINDKCYIIANVGNLIALWDQLTHHKLIDENGNWQKKEKNKGNTILQIMGVLTRQQRHQINFRNEEALLLNWLVILKDQAVTAGDHIIVLLGPQDIQNMARWRKDDGKDGKHGKDGKDGKDDKDGNDGNDGDDGDDGDEDYIYSALQGLVLRNKDAYRAYYEKLQLTKSKLESISEDGDLNSHLQQKIEWLNSHMPTSPQIEACTKNPNSRRRRFGGGGDIQQLYVQLKPMGASCFEIESSSHYYVFSCLPAGVPEKNTCLDLLRLNQLIKMGVCRGEFGQDWSSNHSSSEPSSIIYRDKKERVAKHLSNDSNNRFSFMYPTNLNSVSSEFTISKTNTITTNTTNTIREVLEKKLKCLFSSSKATSHVWKYYVTNDEEKCDDNDEKTHDGQDSVVEDGQDSDVVIIEDEEGEEAKKKEEKAKKKEEKAKKKEEKAKTKEEKAKKKKKEKDDHEEHFGDDVDVDDVDVDDVSDSPPISPSSPALPSLEYPQNATPKPVKSPELPQTPSETSWWYAAW